jgi:hypothetical protein
MPRPLFPSLVLVLVPHSSFFVLFFSPFFFLFLLSRSSFSFFVLLSRSSLGLFATPILRRDSKFESLQKASQNGRRR